MISEYHSDYIAAYWRGEISLRQLRVLVEHLPPGSAAHRAAGYTWAELEYLVAELLDVNNSTWELLRAANSEDTTYKPPDRIPRPGAGTGEEQSAREKARERRTRERDLAVRRAQLQPLIDQLLPPKRREPLVTV